MNNPYPSNRSLREESLADRLLDDQYTAAQAFRRALETFAATFDRLEFPLGSPIRGYGLADIHDQINDWMVMRDDFEDAANDAARDLAERA